MKALLRQNLAEVRAALDADSEAAKLPFFDHSVEPPLCCAVREGCKPEIIGALLEKQANVNATNVHGQSPLLLLLSSLAKPARRPTASLESSPPWATASLSLFGLEEAIGKAMALPPQHQKDVQIQIATRLLAAGADEHLPDHQGATAATLAVPGSGAVASLVRYYCGVQACHVLWSGARSGRGAPGGPFSALPMGLVDQMCSYLVPESIKERLARAYAMRETQLSQ